MLLLSNSKKAPGIDGISAEILKCAGLSQPQVLLEVFNEVLRTGVFPEVWKIAKVVLIMKLGKPEFSPSSYRPLCLLSTTGKLFESLIARRLQQALGEDGLSGDQYGFRPKRSTVNAVERVCKIVKAEMSRTLKTRKLCLMVTVDIRNAFGTAPWRAMVDALKEKSVPWYITRLIKSYFQERVLITPNGREMNMHAGVPTGSVLGPTLWNIFYDGILRLKVPKGVTMVGYADDLAIVVTSKKEEELEVKVEETLRMVGRWLEEHGLTLAAERTEAILLIGRKRLSTSESC